MSIFINNMEISSKKYPNNNQPFSGLLEISAGVQNNAVLNRGLVDLAGTVSGVINANNKYEAAEKIRQEIIFVLLAFIAPILNVPAANRIFMKFCGLTEGWADCNHKAIQLSNKYLVSPEKTLEGLKKYNILNDINGKSKISERFFSAPIEKVVKKISGEKLNDHVDIERLLKNCGGNLSLLQKRLSRAKNLTLCSDLLITCLSLGFWKLLNNTLTKKVTGKTGFSAELEMADEKIIAQRTENYEKNKKKNINKLLAEIALISTIIPLAVHKGLTSKSKNLFTNFIKKFATLTDYTKGVFMSKFITLIGCIVSATGIILFSRNNTEKKDWAIRIPVTLSVFMAGDLVATSLMSNISDRIFKTKLCKDNQKGLIKKIFPIYKSLEQIGKEISLKQIAPKNRTVATGIYWAGSVLFAGLIHFIVYKFRNSMIKKDVKNYVENNNGKLRKNYEIPEIFKQFLINKT